jgi:N-acylneuraminate cytidylyltransferase
MTAARERLAVIPARGGSKRLPRKHLRPLGGRPAIAHTIDAALASGLFARVVVSTDDEEIAAVALRHGADVPFLRSADLADDRTGVSAATVDALERLDPHGTRYRQVAQLLATCPLRTAADVEASHAHFEANGCRTQLSVVRFGWLNPWWAMRLEPDDALAPVFPADVERRSQDLPPLVCPTGAIWWSTAERLRSERTYHVPGRTGWAIDWTHAVDVDTHDDWRAAELLMSLRQAEEVGQHAG